MFTLLHEGFPRTQALCLPVNTFKLGRVGLRKSGMHFTGNSPHVKQHPASAVRAWDMSV